VPWGHELNLQFAGHHLPLGFAIETDMACNHLAQHLGIDELADASARSRGVIRDQGEVALVLSHELVNEPFRRPHGHETSDHQACTIGDHGDRSLE
jgi:hypothetical protein